MSIVLTTVKVCPPQHRASHQADDKRLHETKRITDDPPRGYHDGSDKHQINEQQEE